MTEASAPKPWTIETWRGRLGWLLAWGLLLALAFPPVNLWPLAHVALVPLTILALRGVPRARTLWMICAAGVLWWSIQLSWLMAVTAPGTVVLAIYLGFYPMAYAWLIARVPPRVPFALSVPTIWIGLEYLRGAILIEGFPWFGLGHSQPALLIQIADVVGAYGVGFVVAMGSGVVVDLLARPLVLPAGGTGRARRGLPLRVSLPAWGAALLVALTYGAWRLAQTDALRGDRLRVAVLQTNLRQSNKDSPSPSRRRENFGHLLSLIERAAAEKPALIVAPETMVPRPINGPTVKILPESARYRRGLEQAVSRHRIPLLVGAHAMTGWKAAPESGYVLAEDRYNCAFLMLPGGGEPQRYAKIHRVPFGEYLPWVDRLPALRQWLMSLTPYGHDYTLTPGESVTVFTLGGGEAKAAWSLATPICFEDVFGYLGRQMVWSPDGKRADVLINLTNDGWFDGTSQPWQHEQMARFRCVENRVPMARAVNTGVSGFFDSAGRPVGQVVVDGRRQGVAGTAVAELVRDPRWTFFALWGDLFGRICTILTAAAWVGPIAYKRWTSSKQTASEA